MIIIILIIKLNVSILPHFAPGRTVVSSESSRSGQDFHLTLSGDFKFWGADSVRSGGEDCVGSSSWNYPQNVPVPVGSSVMDPTGPSSATYRPEWLSSSGKFCVILSGPIGLNIPHACRTLHPVTWDATAPFLPGPHPPLCCHRNSFLWGWRQGLRSSPQSTSSPAVSKSAASTGTRRPQINYVTSFSISAQNHTWRAGNLEGFCCLKSIGEGGQGGKREDTIARFTREGNIGKYSKSNLLHFSK